MDNGHETNAQSGYTGVYDLSGNVWEWEDSCDGQSGQNDSCRLRGGSFNDGNDNLRCGDDNYDYRSGSYDFVGLRCCGPP